MYTVQILLLKEKYIVDIENAFEDRDDITTEVHPSIEPGLSYMTISNVHQVTMTPLMWWILHHIDKSDYYQIIIS